MGLQASDADPGARLCLGLGRHYMTPALGRGLPTPSDFSDAEKCRAGVSCRQPQVWVSALPLLSGCPWVLRALRKPVISFMNLEQSRRLSQRGIGSPELDNTCMGLTQGLAAVTLGLHSVTAFLAFCLKPSVFGDQDATCTRWCLS